ncbi:MAG: NUDIX domain-containing protein [Candidatus Acidiferrum sp.]
MSSTVYALPVPRGVVGVLWVDEGSRVLLTLLILPPEAGCWSIVGAKLDYLESLELCAVREAREKVGVEIVIRSLLCVTEYRLPAEQQHWISPAFLAQVLCGTPSNCEPGKTLAVRWFPLAALPPNLTMTARNAIEAYKRSSNPL